MLPPVQLIRLNKKLVAIAAGGRLIVDNAVNPDELQTVHAMGLYAIEIHAGYFEREYTDHDALEFAKTAAQSHTGAVDAFE